MQLAEKTGGTLEAKDTRKYNRVSQPETICFENGGN